MTLAEFLIEVDVICRRTNLQGSVVSTLNLCITRAVISRSS